MRRLSLIIITTLLAGIFLAACGGNKSKIRIKGSFKNLGDGQFFAFSYSPEWNAFDTINIKDGSFDFTHSVDDTVLVTLQYPNFMQTTVVAIPGKTINIDADANHLIGLKVSGSEENELLTDFRLRNAKTTVKQKEREAQKIIEKNPSSFASQALLQDYFLNAEQIDYKKVEKLLGLMLKAAPNRVQLRSINSQLQPFFKVGKGAQLPKFSAKTIKGKTVNNATFKGKPLLISFWSTWAGEMEYPVCHLRQTLRQTGTLSRLSTLNICLDADTVQCQMRVRRDTIPGYTVCDRMTWNSPLVNNLGVRFVPGNILVDKNGKVLERDIKTENLEMTIRKYIK